jgi:hypothetical protein
MENKKQIFTAIGQDLGFIWAIALCAEAGVAAHGAGRRRWQLGNFGAIKRNIPLAPLLQRYGVKVRRKGHDKWHDWFPIHRGEARRKPSSRPRVSNPRRE